MKKKRETVAEYCEREAREHLALSEGMSRSFEKEALVIKTEAERLSLIALGQAYGFEQVLKFMRKRR